MLKYSFLPIYKCGMDELVDGSVIKLTEFCKRNKNGKCEKFYREIFDKEGIHVCPYGFNTFVSLDNNEIDIFTGFRVKDKFDIKKVNSKIKKTDINRVISDLEMKSYIESYKLITSLEKEKKYLFEFIGNTIHDVRKFNSNIKTRSELISNKAKSSKKRDIEQVKKLSENIWAMSQLISTRLSEYDYLYAEYPLKSGSKYEFNFFTTFDKIRRCMGEEVKKGQKEIAVRANGTCPPIQAYDSIKYMPFLLIDNALKYSLNNSIIEVKIKDEERLQTIEIKSTGIYVDDSEIEHLFKRGYRGKNANEFTEEGSGIGLYLVKEICEANDIKIEIKTSKVLDISSSKRKNDQGTFNVILYAEK